MQVRKAFQFQPQGYVLTYTSEMRSRRKVLNPVVLWGPGLGDSVHVAGAESFFGTYVQRPQPILMKDGKVERLAIPQQQPSHQGTFPFAGVDDHYFIAMAVETGPRAGAIRDGARVDARQPGLQRDMVAWRCSSPSP